MEEEGPFRDLSLPSSSLSPLTPSQVLQKKGKEFFKELEAPKDANTAVHTPYAGELAGGGDSA